MRNYYKLQRNSASAYDRVCQKVVICRRFSPFAFLYRPLNSLLVTPGITTNHYMYFGSHFLDDPPLLPIPLKGFFITLPSTLNSLLKNLDNVICISSLSFKVCCGKERQKVRKEIKSTASFNLIKRIKSSIETYHI